VKDIGTTDRESERDREGEYVIIFFSWTEKTGGSCLLLNLSRQGHRGFDESELDTGTVRWFGVKARQCAL